MLEEMRRNVRNASLIVKNLFNQFDLHGRGCVSAEQFLRVISCHGLLSANKVWAQAIMERVVVGSNITLVCEGEHLFVIEKLQQLTSDRQQDAFPLKIPRLSQGACLHV